MGKFCGTRAPRRGARLLAYALIGCCCWLGIAVARAVAEEGGEPDAGAIRVLKGAEWSREWQPFATDTPPPARVLGLRGASWGNTAARPPEPRAAAGPAGVVSGPFPGDPSPGEGLIPALALPPAPRATPGDVWTDLFRRSGSDSSPSHVTVLVLPAIIQAPPRQECAGGHEACEVRATAGDEGTAAPRRPVQAGGGEEETLGPVSAPAARSRAGTSEPEPRDQPPPRDSAYQSALVQFVTTAAAVIVALGVFCAGLLLLRRVGVPLPVGSWPGPAGGGVAAAPAPEPGTEHVPEAVADFDLASNFDLGPTYAEEARQREEAAREREEAVLRQLFEQNLRLHEQIAGPADSGEPAAPRDQ